MKNNDFDYRLKKIFSFDKIRLLKIIEIIQYTTIFVFLSIGFSYLLNNFIFYEIDKKDYEKMSTFLLIIYLIVDLTIVLLVYFYMKKIGYLFPSVGNIFYKKFIPFTTFEYILDIPGLYLFLELTDGLKEKIEELSKRINKRDQGFLL